jgi:hypothetical protein
MILALDSTQKGVLFSYRDGEYQKYTLFVNDRLRQIQGIVRTKSEAPTYAFGASLTFSHCLPGINYIRSLTAAIQRFTLSQRKTKSFILLQKNSIRGASSSTHRGCEDVLGPLVIIALILYASLRGATAIAFDIKSMFLTSSPEGVVGMVNVMKDGNWVKMMQDMDTTTWQEEIIKVPVLDQVEKQRVYYIEVTFQDEDRMPTAGEPRGVLTKDFTHVALKVYFTNFAALNLSPSL